MVPMGGAKNRSLINEHFLLSTYFLIAQTYKRMYLITEVYGDACDCMSLYVAFIVHMLYT